MLVIDLCLSDIPKTKMTKSEKNGKFYCKVVVNELQNEDKYGNTHSVRMQKPKDSQEETIWVGKGKEYTQKKSESYNAVPLASNDLPF